MGDVRDKARELRKKCTTAERLIWNRLRKRRLLGLKFRRQHPIGRFVVDFYCPKLRLAVEIDGGYHLGRGKYDLWRDEILKSMGVTVIRFWNEEVLSDLDDVVEKISVVCEMLKMNLVQGAMEENGPPPKLQVFGRRVVPSL